MGKVLATLLTGLTLTINGDVIASAQDIQHDNDTSYFCTGEMAAGLQYNDSLKKWEGAIFKAEAKFVLHMKFLRRRVEKDVLNSEKSVADYEVKVTRSGAKVAHPCWGFGKDHDITVVDSDQVNCYSAWGYLTFNLTTNRFLEAYLVGYVSGEDNNLDTPAVSGGVCTKID